MTSDDAAMMLFGVRYCLGRQTYAPGLCCDWLKKKWPEIRQPDRDMVLRDIHHEVEARTDGDRLVETWRGFLRWAEADAVNRAEHRRLADLAKEPTS